MANQKQRRIAWLDFERDANQGRLAAVKLREQIHRGNALAPHADIDEIARLTQEKREALRSVTIDGSNIWRFSPSLRAINHNIGQLSEADLRNSGAVPLSALQVKQADALEKHRQSLEYLRQTLAAPAMTLEQISGDRVRIAYRLVRQLALIKGDTKLGRLLVQDLSSAQYHLSKWEFPWPYAPGTGLFRHYSHICEVLLSLNEYPVIYTWHGNNCKPVYTWGVSYLPVPVPDAVFPDQNPLVLAEMRRNRIVPDNYDPFDDYGLIAQLFVYEQIAEVLDIGRDDPREAAALSALVHPGIARLAWPTHDEIEMYEEQILMPWIYSIICDFSYEHVATLLQTTLHLSYIEAMDYVEAAKHFIAHVAKYPKEVEKGVMLSKIDRLLDVCVRDGLVTTALNAMKLKMQAIGLTTPGEDLHEDRQLALSSGLREILKKHEDPNQQLSIEGTEQ